MAYLIARAIDALHSQLFQGQANSENVSYRIKSADFVKMNLLDVNAVNRCLSLTKTTENFFCALFGSCGRVAAADQRQDVFEAAMMMRRRRCTLLAGVMVVVVMVVVVVVMIMLVAVVMSVPVVMIMIIMRGVSVDHIKVSADDSMFASASGELQAYRCQPCLVQCFFHGFWVYAEVEEGSQDHVAGCAGQGFERDDSWAC